MQTDTHRKNTTLTFTGLREFTEYAEGCPNDDAHRPTIHEKGDRAEWAGGTPAQAIAIGRGLEMAKSTDEVEKLLSKIDVAFRDRERVGWEPSICGAYPMVADFLSGNPECMRQRTNVADDRAPVNLYVSLFVSGSIAPRDVIKRGAAAAALAMRLAEERPVQLWAVLEGELVHKSGTVVLKIPVPTHGMSAADVAAALASPSTTRILGFSAVVRFDGGWNGIPSPGEQACRKLLNLSERDIYVPPAVSGDGNIGDPVQWVTKHLDKQREIA